MSLHLSDKQIRARVGLVSDTHMPERLVAFPESIFDVLNDVDLLLHAGDVGELWVLDRLSVLAPVVAVHGNDDTHDAQRELPYQQLVSIAGIRILLWHSHYPDPREDQARRSTRWQPIWKRQADRASRVGADVVVFGHTHVPLSHRHEDVVMVNPGALASGSILTHQVRQTVALLSIMADGTCSVVHIDLAEPDRVYVPHHDWEAGFDVALQAFEAPIVEQDLVEDVGRLRAERYDDLGRVKEAILPLARACWAGQRHEITRWELLEQVEGSAAIAPTDRDKIVTILRSPRA